MVDGRQERGQPPGSGLWVTDPDLEFSSRIRLYLKRQTKRRGLWFLDVDDALQDTWVAALQNRKQFRGRTEEELLRWLVGIARNLVLTVLRSPETRRRLSVVAEDLVGLDALPSSHESPEDQVAREERADQLREALQTFLSELERDVVRLVFFRGYGFQEVAQRLGLSARMYASRNVCRFSRLNR